MSVNGRSQAESSATNLQTRYYTFGLNGLEEEISRQEAERMIANYKCYKRTMRFCFFSIAASSLAVSLTARLGPCKDLSVYGCWKEYDYVGTAEIFGFGTIATVLFNKGFNYLRDRNLCCLLNGTFTGTS